jgi:hypothetical protein
MVLPAYVAAVVLSGAAVIRDRGSPERRSASLAAFVWTGTSAARVEAAVGIDALLLFALDLALVLFLIALAWKARYGWPVLAAFCQAIGAAALLAHLTDPRVSGELHLTVSTAATHLTGIVLLAGVWFQRSPKLGEAAKASIARVTQAARNVEDNRTVWPAPQTGPGQA